MTCLRVSLRHGEHDSIEVDDVLELGGLDNVERHCIPEKEVEEVVRLLVF